MCIVCGLHAQTRLSTGISPDSISRAVRPATFHCLTDSLGAGESFYFIHVAAGCFFYHRDSLWVAKTNSGFKVKYGERVKTISDTKADVIRDFEYRLYLADQISDHCTSSETFLVRKGSVVYRVAHDPTCGLRLFDKLLTDLDIR